MGFIKTTKNYKESRLLYPFLLMGFIKTTKNYKESRLLYPFLLMGFIKTTKNYKVVLGFYKNYKKLQGVTWRFLSPYPFLGSWFTASRGACDGRGRRF